MQKGKAIKLTGNLVSIFGLIFMVYSWVKWDDLNMVFTGLFMVNIGVFIYLYGKKNYSES